MKQYIDLLKEIKSKGTYKPEARKGMPGTISLFGYQFRHNLSTGFPLLTTKKMYWKGVVIELLWFLRGDTNIKYLVDNDVNIWNEDAYNFYTKKFNLSGGEPLTMLSFTEFIERVQKGLLDYSDVIPGYKLGDCGFQYGKVWRDWGGYGIESLDQIKSLIKSLTDSPMGRRHIVTAIDPNNAHELALYWCHAMFQFNCRALTKEERYDYAQKNRHDVDMFPDNVPKYYLDCQLYQMSADSFLGVPFNIASYALLIHIIADICNMVPGEFIHTFGDVHIYDDHMEAVDTQIQREPGSLPKLVVNSEFWGITNSIDRKTFDFRNIMASDFSLENYNPAPGIKAKLSTGLK